MPQALSPAMDQWRKRISRIATSFEVAHKAELKTAEKDALDSKAKQASHFAALPLHFHVMRHCLYINCRMEPSAWIGMF